MTNNPAFKNLSQINKKKHKLIYEDEQFKKVLSPVPHIYICNIYICNIYM